MPRRDFDQEHIAGARSMPLDELLDRMDELDADTDVIAYCRGPFCSLADSAVRLLTSSGYRALRLDDGLAAWVRAGLPSES